MLKILQNSNIYVHCPAGVVTGGVELLHQLVSILRSYKRNAYIVYFGDLDHTIPADYSKYNVETTDYIENNPNNIEIYTETMTKLVSQDTRLTQKIIWWLSADNYINNDLPLSDLFRWNTITGFHVLRHRIKETMTKGRYPETDNSLFDTKYNKYVFAFQSEYIQDYLHKRKHYTLLPLKDYINKDHDGTFSIIDKQDIVLYNPSKGYEFTKQLIEISPEINWVPLKGMTRDMLKKVMQKAKLYIDFGNHPGKDRLPRECAMNGCCIITGMRGSARYFEDVPIDDKYKFNEKKSSKIDIIQRIKWVLENYDTAIKDFDYYRNIISNEEEEFVQQVKCIFNIQKE